MARQLVEILKKLDWEARWTGNTINRHSSVFEVSNEDPLNPQFPGCQADLDYKSLARFARAQNLGPDSKASKPPEAQTNRRKLPACVPGEERKLHRPTVVTLYGASLPSTSPQPP